MIKKEQQLLPKELEHVNLIARWMDNRFRIPGTDIRFGLDGLIGLIPGVGDFSTFVVSGYLVLLMARNGASGYVLARMIFNIVLDAAIGSVPFVGDIFDFAFKANAANVSLMQKYYQQGRYRGSAWKLIIPVLILLGLVIAGIIWGLYKLFSAIF